ncbi:MAG: hypothetical protein JNM30_14110 [Rhodospirillales bacterium]|nr:hypothetical protein [Rhodospirillales bacterium]
MNVIPLHAQTKAGHAGHAADDGSVSVRHSIAALNAAIKSMHLLWQASPNAAGIELIIRWQELRDRLELLDLQAPHARSVLEEARSQLLSLNDDFVAWCETVTREAADSPAGAA